jgi:branched-chain amino acid transport system permease protein
MSGARLPRESVRAGAIAGAVVVYFAFVGMIERLHGLRIVGANLTLDWVLVFGPPIVAASLSVRPRVVAGERVRPTGTAAVASGAAVGVVAAAVVALAVAAIEAIGVDTVRSVFRSASPKLLEILSFHMGEWAGTALLCGMIVAAGVAGAVYGTADRRVRRAVGNGVAAVILAGLLQRIVPTALDQLNIERDWLYSAVTLGLTAIGAIVVFVVVAGASFALAGRRLRDLVRPRRAADADGEHPLDAGMTAGRAIALVVTIALAAVLVALPYLVGPVVSRILGTVGIFLLLGLGLNIVVGYAGLLDLGYVAFFSVGAYTTAVLTGAQRVTFTGLEPPAFGAHLSFWLAIPIVVVIAAMIGVLIGAPVLRLRGDYLAIVTLGFGEIARVIFGSTWAQSLFGGSAGMTEVTKAPIGSFQFQDDPRHFYYLALGFCLIAIFVSWRLQASRIGRAWNAMREDEQVADAMGISTIRYKLLAFAMGGAVGSLGGAIFAVSIGSLQIASFGIIVSITALAIIILGGMGSIPGVVIGALVLIGIPGVLSEFEDYQLLIYGAVLIAIMILKPEGLLPNVRRSRELREEERAQDQWARHLLEQDAAVAPQPTGGEIEP